MKKILIVHLSGIGNTVAILPLINKIQRVYQNSIIDILLAQNRGGETIVKNATQIKSIYFLEKIDYMNKFDKFLFLYKKSQELPKYDIAITTYPNQGIFSALLMYFSAGQRIQHRYKYGNFLLSYAPEIKYTNFVEQNLNLVPYKNLNEDFKINYHISEENEKFAMEHIPNGKVIVGIHPGGFNDMEYKRYDINKWLNMIEMLHKKNSNYQFFIFGGPSDDLSFFQENDYIKIFKDIALEKTIALISKVDIFLSNDSGLAHIASMFNKKQLILFGATDPVYSKPYSENAFAITPKNFKPFYIPHKGIVNKINFYINEIDEEYIIKKIESLI
ncbi:heptosyltransferase-3 [Desulfonauticus submarinus]|uniref:Heptosyltransferase-3 n=1 Tax=Desulfonauticus submarinus TaxID=206665 RepID=A0A1H0BZ17_9BACT|nr:glycosyltransferase family 9 protein [Desulfonauticus submarinus]SDN50864.1 heptosyltransferase-3 [Desulfonauticus submarinus]